MVDTSKIHALIRRARRRLRAQAALEAGTTASIVAVASALVASYLMRSGVVNAGTGVALLAASAGLVVAGAVLGALRRFPTHIVAARIDRACNLADRLSSACAFERIVAETRDPETAALMQAAMRDAVAALPRANVAAATRFQAPRDGRAAVAFAMVSTLIAGLYWPEPGGAAPVDRVAGAPGDARKAPEAPADTFVDEDIEYARELLADLGRVARQENEPHLDRFVSEVQEILARAERGEISKEKLLEELARAEQRYMQGADGTMDEAMSELRTTGRELEKSELTREIGKALAQGDLARAQQEMEKLAQKLEDSALSDKDRQSLAKALDRAAERFDKAQKQREERIDKDIAKAEDELRRLERKQRESKDEEEKQRLARKAEDKQRELKRLEREKEQQQSADKRTLKQLHRNMQKAAEQMQKQQNEGQQERQERQRMASRNLRDAAEDTGKVDADRRKMAAQKKVASQLGDLKEAMRRARRSNRDGLKDLFGKNKRSEDFRRRAGGQQGSRSAWRPGSGQGQQGQGQQGQGQGQQGQGPGGDAWGEGHDPDVLGDATARSGKTQDESLTGVHGRGPSRRETILAAAQKGFASRAYQQVYAEYKTIVEEVIRAENVPSGYKYYVKRYFQKIKPHAMD